MTARLSSPVVSLIVECRDRPGLVLLQRRSKPEGPGLSDLLELPQGRIRGGESFLDCAKRELAEETGLADFVLTTPIACLSIGSERLEFATTATLVSEAGYHSYFAICLVGEASGHPRSSRESKDPGWFSRAQVIALINANAVYPLNVPMLLSYYR